MVPPALAVLGPAESVAQFRRDAAVPAIGGVARGEFFAGLGASLTDGGRYPLSGLSGDLWSPGEITVGYGPADRVAVRVRGAIWQVLSIDERGESAVPLDASTGDGTATDHGDFRITAAFAPFGAADGFSAGGLVEVKLPNTDETRGIGPNTTDVTLGLLGSWGFRRGRATAMLGIAILEAPLESFVQNDLAAYALELRLDASDRVRVFLSADGVANTRGVVPLGTEDRGRIGLVAELALRDWRLDGGIRRGYGRRGADWIFGVGVGRVWPGRPESDRGSRGRRRRASCSSSPPPASWAQGRANRPT